ncbi:amidohydrolase family protein [Arthrobacter ginkgonis]|uniref:Amidohydrolase family protein n=1 Tax=Arthrobacter ginkgonis TaxID=1630594 RepID=A0ABP7C342_9MICC
MSTHRYLVRGGHIVTGDPALGVIADGELLIEGDTIVAVGRDLGVTDAEVIDAGGGIIAPGTIDTHRHTWQTQLRGAATTISLQEYIAGFWADSTPSYTAEDVHVGTLVGALDAINAGVTTVLDYSHITNSPEHADAAVDALEESGIRAVYAYGMGQADIMAPPAYDRLADFARLANERFTAPGRVTLGAALSEIGLAPISQNLAQKRLADEHGAISTAHIATSQALPAGVEQLHAAGVLDPRLVLVHATTLAETDWKLVADAGAKLSTTPESELNMGMGRIAINDAIRHGLKPTIGADVVSLNSGDIFTPARQALGYARWADAEATLQEGRDVYGITLNPADAFEWATANGADALGLGDTVGTLAPGKQADLIVIGGQHVGVRPVNDPVGQLVMQTHPGLIDTVIVAGQVLKRDGLLVGAPVAALLARLDESSRRIQERIAKRQAAKVPLPPEVLAGFPGWVAHNLAN